MPLSAAFCSCVCFRIPHTPSASRTHSYGLLRVRRQQRAQPAEARALGTGAPQVGGCSCVLWHAWVRQQLQGGVPRCAVVGCTLTRLHTHLAGPPSSAFSSSPSSPSSTRCSPRTRSCRRAAGGGARVSHGSAECLWLGSARGMAVPLTVHHLCHCLAAGRGVHHYLLLPDV